MKTNTLLRLAALLAAPFVALSSAHAQTLILDMESANYVGTTWVDASATGNNASAYAGGPSATASTTPNGSVALDFGQTPGGGTTNGGTTGLTLGSAISFTNTSQFTYEIVANTGSLTSDGIVVGQSTASPPGFPGAPGLRLNATVNGDTIDMAHQTQYDQPNGPTLAANTWYVIAVTVSGSTYSYYVNGALVGTTTDGNGFAAMTGSQIGTGAGASGFDGDLASVRVYNGALTQSQITSDYNTLSNLYLVPEPSSVALLMTAFGALSLCCFFGKVRRIARI